MKFGTLALASGLLAAVVCGIPASAQQPPLETGEQLFGTLCAGCHGAGATGGAHGPSLVNSRGVRARSEAQLQQVIREGTSGGMPPFSLAQEQLQALAQWIRSLNVPVFELKPAGDVAAGEQFFFGKGQCSSCHMIAGRGGSNGPDLSDVGRQLGLRDLLLALDNPAQRATTRTASNCASWAWCPQITWAKATVRLRSGATLRGLLRNQGKHDLQLQTPDGRLHLLKDTEYLDVTREQNSSMPPLKASPEERRDLVAFLSSRGGITEGALAKVWSPLPADAFDRILKPNGEWPTYNGNVSGNRHSPLDQINIQNASRLRLEWSYFVPATGLQTTPVVMDGIMYVSSPDRVAALDSRTGREIWSFQYRDPSSTTPPPPITIASLGGGRSVQRGVAVLGDRVFFTSANAHLLCLNRLTGGLMWDVPMHRGPGRSSGPVAPLVVGDLVIAGMSGGDTPLIGYLAAFKATTGEEVWRFHPIPKPGEPGSETWGGSAIANGGGATWLTGSYDPESGVLYWATGQPYPPTDGAQRDGDNIYTNCVVALDPKSGKMLWYYQFTPHDLHDWDANEPLVLVNTRYNGSDRKLMLQANRNGFFYVLDRTDGKLLLGKPFVKNITWASGIGPNGRPQLLEGNDPTREGSKSCPAVRGATNWYSTAFHPGTRLFYVMAVEDCTIYRQGQGGIYVPFRDPSNPPIRSLRALEIETGRIVWEIPQVGPPEFNYSGVLTTAGNLLFYGETGGSFAAVDAKTGKNLWHVNTGQQWRASPMTYMVNGRQYVAIAAGSNILSFALPGE